MRKINRKGQEEIVGFILIVVLVAVAFVIFLGVKLRNPVPVQKESAIVYQFLESAMEQTTDCMLKENGKNLQVKELIKDCNSVNSACISGKNSCDITQETIKQMLNSSWNVNTGSFYNGYELTAKYSQDAQESSSKEIFSIVKGNCSLNYVGDSYSIPEFPGKIVVNAKICSN